jgi:hypothetical protein
MAQPDPVAAYAQAVFDATNEARAANNLPPLNADSRLATAAALWAQECVAAGQLAHELPGRPGMEARIRAQGYRFSLAGENLAAVTFSAQELVDAFMADPVHRNNLLHPRFRDMGVGVQVVPDPMGGPPVMWVVQNVAQPKRGPDIVIRVTPELVRFGGVLGGAVAAGVVTVTNVSEAGAPDLQGRLVVPASPQFSLAPGADGSFRLARRQSANIGVRFTPRAAAGGMSADLGRFSVAARVESNANRPEAQPVIVMLVGVGLVGGPGPRIHLDPDPPAIGFGAVSVNARPRDANANRQIVISNVGGPTLTVRIRGVRAPFNSPNFPAITSLAPGEYVALDLRALPKEKRLYTTQLAIISNDPMRPEITIELSVTGVP